jgi:hypothetical protein
MSDSSTPRNPQDEIEQQEGKYEDPVEKLSTEEKVDYMPKGPDPQPFKLGGSTK